MLLLTAALLISFILIGALSLAILIHVYPLRNSSAIRALMVLLLGLFFISFGALGVYTAQDFELKVAFSRFRFIGFGTLGPAWLLFVSASFDRWRWLQKPAGLTLLFGPSVLVVLSSFLPGGENLILTGFAPVTVRGFSLLRFENGPLFWVHGLSAYLTVSLSFLIFISVYRHESAEKRRQIVALFSGSLIPILVDNYSVHTNAPARWLMLSGASFVFLCVAIASSVFRHRLLDIKPVVTEKIFNDIPDPILVFDSRNALRSFNKAAQRIFKIPRRSYGLPASKIFPFLNLNENEISLSDGDGRQRFFQVRTEKLNRLAHDAEGRIVLFREITSQKAIERELSESLSFKADLLSLMAHDLIGNVNQQAMVSSLLQKQVGPELRKTAELLADSTTATHDLMTNVLSWVQSQENDFEPLYRKFEMGALISECLEVLAPNAKLRSVTLEKDFPPEPVIVEGDSMMISSVLRNLLSNALKAAPIGTSVRVAFAASDSKVEVRVSDRGSGMSPEQIENVKRATGRFAPDQGRTLKSSGYGIGLRIVQRFIELHEGRFWVESSPGQGTRACFWIPLQIPESQLRGISGLHLS